MSLTRDSLGGQNSHRRVSGARSSRALSTIFKRLRKLDRKISEIDKKIAYWRYVNTKQWPCDFYAKRVTLDLQRKNTRSERKNNSRQA